MTASRVRELAGFAGYLLLFAWLDWITHRSVIFILIVGVGLFLGAVFRARIAAAIRSFGRRDTSGVFSGVLTFWDGLPWQVQRILVALTPLIYFVFRGQGTSGAGFVVVVATLVVVLAIVLFGARLDKVLDPLYAARDGLLPRWLRVVLAPVLAVLIAFVVVHGSLLDLPALFGGTTHSPQSPVGLEARFLFATLLAGACTVLLVRERNSAS
ncbi:MAG TPA: hypothetical protein DGT23_22800 [Micromonosporaceae bacterium]|nr:hypothetical protein [Micromonosporaceae bacterium]